MANILINKGEHLIVLSEYNPEIDILIRIKQISNGEAGDPRIEELNIFHKAKKDEELYKLIYSKRYIKPGKENEEDEL